MGLINSHRLLALERGYRHFYLRRKNYRWRRCPVKKKKAVNLERPETFVKTGGDWCEWKIQERISEHFVNPHFVCFSLKNTITWHATSVNCLAIRNGHFSNADTRFIDMLQFFSSHTPGVKIYPSTRSLLTIKEQISRINQILFLGCNLLL